MKENKKKSLRKEKRKKIYFKKNWLLKNLFTYLRHKIIIKKKKSIYRAKIWKAKENKIYTILKKFVNSKLDYYF
jgi:hypothetical protein